MAKPDYLHGKGEYEQHDYGSFVVLELKKTHDLHVYSAETKIPITWRTASYYRSRGVPTPDQLENSRVCEVGPGLAEFALFVPGITIIDPVDYGELSFVLSDVARNTSDEHIQQVAASLSNRARSYQLLLGEQHIQLSVQDAVSSYRDLRGQFDVVISAHVSEHYGWTSGFKSSVNALSNNPNNIFVL